MMSTSEKYVLDLLSNDSFLMVNKSLLRALGDCDEAIVLSAIVSAHKTFRDKVQDGWIFQTIDYLERDLGITYYRQQKAIRSLTEKYLIETKRMGMPALRYIRLNMGNIEALLLDQKPIPLPEIKSKKEFYIALQEAGSFEEFRSASGNIKEELVEAMWCWTFNYRTYTKSNFPWNSKEFGIFKSWFYKVKQPLDWSRLSRIFKRFFIDVDEPSLFKFIEYERGIPENPPNQRVYNYKEIL